MADLRSKSKRSEKPSEQILSKAKNPVQGYYASDADVWAPVVYETINIKPHVFSTNKRTVSPVVTKNTNNIRGHMDSDANVWDPKVTTTGITSKNKNIVSVENAAKIAINKELVEKVTDNYLGQVTKYEKRKRDFSPILESLADLNVTNVGINTDPKAVVAAFRDALSRTKDPVAAARDLAKTIAAQVKSGLMTYEVAAEIAAEIGKLDEPVTILPGSLISTAIDSAVTYDNVTFDLATTAEVFRTTYLRGAVIALRAILDELPGGKNTKLRSVKEYVESKMVDPDDATRFNLEARDIADLFTFETLFNREVDDIGVDAAADAAAEAARLAAEAAEVARLAAAAEAARLAAEAAEVARLAAEAALGARTARIDALRAVVDPDPGATRIGVVADVIYIFSMVTKRWIAKVTPDDKYTTSTKLAGVDIANIAQFTTDIRNSSLVYDEAAAQEDIQNAYREASVGGNTRNKTAITISTGKTVTRRDGVDIRLIYEFTYDKTQKSYILKQFGDTGNSLNRTPIRPAIIDAMVTAITYDRLPITVSFATRNNSYKNNTDVNRRLDDLLRQLDGTNIGRVLSALRVTSGGFAKQISSLGFSQSSKPSLRSHGRGESVNRNDFVRALDDFYRRGEISKAKYMSVMRNIDDYGANIDAQTAKKLLSNSKHGKKKTKCDYVNFVKTMDGHLRAGRINSFEYDQAMRLYALDST